MYGIGTIVNVQSRMCVCHTKHTILEMVQMSIAAYEEIGGGGVGIQQ